jgi:hypothetical protein
MNALAYDETEAAFDAPYIDLAFLAGEEGTDQGAVSTRFSRGATDSFPADQYGADGNTTPPRAASEPFSVPAEKSLLGGILKQAARDVRRFRNATTAVERELYLEAYSWIAANDFSWPFSFLNVCKALGLMPEVVRGALLGNSSRGWFGYCRKIGGRLTRALRSSFVSGFTEPRTLEQPASNWS